MSTMSDHSERSDHSANGRRDLSPGQRLKNAISRGEWVFGPNVQFTSPWLVELIGECGFDFVLLDGEHGAVFDRLAELITAADSVGMAPIVRVPSHDRGWILRALEYGAAGVQVPMVETVAQTQQLVRETRFSPIGGRGFSAMSKAARFGAWKPTEIGERGNDRTLLIPQLETKRGIENAGAIARVPGIDLLFIGPGDLAQSLGMPGSPEAPEVTSAMIEAIKAIGSACPMYTSAFSTEGVRKWSGFGIRCFLTSSVKPMRQAFEALSATLRAGAEAE